MRLTCSIPCYGRPERTRRMIQSIIDQTMIGWEARVVGDGCPVIQEIIDSGIYKEAQKALIARGNCLIISNLDRNYGGCGYQIINKNLAEATGRYFIFGGNDDIFMPNHFDNYVTFMEENPDLDFAFFNSRLDFIGGIRDAVLSPGGVGHSELIVKTNVAKSMPPHGKEYGHDWAFIDNLIRSGAKFRKADFRPPTYRVMGVPGNREQGID